MDNNKQNVVRGAFLNTQGGVTLCQNGQESGCYGFADYLVAASAQLEQSQPPVPRVGGITCLEGLTRYYLSDSLRLPLMKADEAGDYVKFSDVAAIASQSQAAQPTKHTDLAKRLRAEADSPHASCVNKSDLRAAADEIDRYYTGMLNWKATAEAKDAAHIAGTSQATKAQAELLKRIIHERDALAQAIADAALKAGIASPDACLTGPHLIMMCNDMAECALAAPVAKEAEKEQQAKPELTVWEGAMPESNGKSNFTAILTRKDAKGLDAFDGFTIARSEYPDRVRYEADCVRHLIGELAEKPWITDYDANKHSGYIAPTTQQAAKAESEQAASEVPLWDTNGEPWNEAAEKADQQAHVMPPTRGTGSQHIGAFTGDLPEHIVARITCAIEHEIDNQLTASGMSVQDMQRQDGDAILAIVLDELAASGCVEVASRGRAQGGNTSKENGSDLASTTSTVSAPTLFAAKRVDGGGYGSWLHTSREQAERHSKNNGPAAPKYEVVGLVEVGAQAAPEEAMADFENKLASACAECGVPDSTYEALCIALATTSTDQANADTGSAE